MITIKITYMLQDVAPFVRTVQYNLFYSFTIDSKT